MTVTGWQVDLPEDRRFCETVARGVNDRFSRDVVTPQGVSTDLANARAGPFAMHGGYLSHTIAQDYSLPAEERKDAYERARDLVVDRARQ